MLVPSAVRLHFALSLPVLRSRTAPGTSSLLCLTGVCLASRPSRPTTALDRGLSTSGLPAAHKNDDPALHCLFRSSQLSAIIPSPPPPIFPPSRPRGTSVRVHGILHLIRALVDDICVRQHHADSPSPTTTSSTSVASLPLLRRRLLCVPVLRLPVRSSCLFVCCVCAEPCREKFPVDLSGVPVDVCLSPRPSAPRRR
jgi:hypothetical protein